MITEIWLHKTRDAGWKAVLRSALTDGSDVIVSTQVYYARRRFPDKEHNDATVTGSVVDWDEHFARALALFEANVIVQMDGLKKQDRLATMLGLAAGLGISSDPFDSIKDLTRPFDRAVLLSDLARSVNSKNNAGALFCLIALSLTDAEKALVWPGHPR